MSGERQTETHQAESLDEHPGSAKYEAMRSAHNQALERAEAAEARVAELEAERDAECDKYGLPEQWDVAPDGSGISHKAPVSGMEPDTAKP